MSILKGEHAIAARACGGHYRLAKKAKFNVIMNVCFSACDKVGNHASSSWVRGAPTAAHDACSRRADESRNQPYGSSVPISVRDLAEGEYELTMGTRSYRSRCVVTASSNVRAMPPTDGGSDQRHRQGDRH